MSPTAWFNNRWCSIESVSLRLSDRGIMQGAILVERLRTCNGTPLDVPQHVQRLKDGCQHLKIALPAEWDLVELVEKCASGNRSCYASDLGVVIIVTPGCIGDSLPTVIVHPDPLPWKRLRSWYRDGQCLVCSSHAVVPAQCWPSSLKTRSRLNYFLAEQSAASVVHEIGDIDAARQSATGAVLVDGNGNLMETATANLLVVEKDAIVSPPLDEILNGISLHRTLRLAQQIGLPIRFAPVTESVVARCSEMLLCGSVGGLWGADRLFDTSGRVLCSLAGPNGTVLQQLQQAWFEDVGLNFVQQALEPD